MNCERKKHFHPQSSPAIDGLQEVIRTNSVEDRGFGIFMFDRFCLLNDLFYAVRSYSLMRFHPNFLVAVVSSLHIIYLGPVSNINWPYKVGSWIIFSLGCGHCGWKSTQYLLKMSASSCCTVQGQFENSVSGGPLWEGANMTRSNHLTSWAF